MAQTIAFALSFSGLLSHIHLECDTLISSLHTLTLVKRAFVTYHTHSARAQQIFGVVLVPHYDHDQEIEKGQQNVSQRCLMHAISEREKYFS